MHSLWLEDRLQDVYHERPYKEVRIFEIHHLLCVAVCNPTAQDAYWNNTRISVGVTSASAKLSNSPHAKQRWRLSELN